MCMKFGNSSTVTNNNPLIPEEGDTVVIECEDQFCPGCGTRGLEVNREGYFDHETATHQCPRCKETYYLL